MKRHQQFYSHAMYYDIAFDFRNVPAECSFMEEVFSSIHGTGPNSFLELAAGPGRHTLEFAKRGLNSAALDIAPSMVEYGCANAERNNLKIDYFCGDMVSFKLPQTFDMAAILMDSASYFLDNDSFLVHLESVSDHLNRNGLYFLEMSHPRDVFNTGKSAGTDWEMEREGVKVHVRWGDEQDVFDPVTQITEVSVLLEYQDAAGNRGEIREKSRQRSFTVNEFEALVRLSSRFDVVKWFGSMDSGIPFDNSAKAWRMIPVLKKR